MTKRRQKHRHTLRGYLWHLLASVAQVSWLLGTTTRAEEQSILNGANVLDPGGRVWTAATPDQATRNYMICPNTFRWFIHMGPSSMAADRDAEFIIELDSPYSAKTAFVMAFDWGW